MGCLDAVHPWAGRSLALVWSSDVELAEAAVSALNVLGYSALVPGARSMGRLCAKADIVVVDERDVGFLPATCRRGSRLIVVGGSPAQVAAFLLSRFGAGEALIGIDPGSSVTGYALVSNSTLVHGTVINGGVDNVVSFICGLAGCVPKNTLVGVGASPSVYERALAIAGGVTESCGLRVALVNEHGSNTERPLGLQGVRGAINVHVRAAAVIALRARMSSMQVMSMH